MTKRHIVISDELWKQAKVAAAQEDTTVSGYIAQALTVRLAYGPQDHVKRLRKIENTDPMYINTWMKPEDIERRTAPLPAGASFGRSVPAPKPMKKGR